LPRLVQQEIRTARAAITDVLKAAPSGAGKIAEALQALDRLERLLEGIAPSLPVRTRRWQRNQPKTYRVEGPPGHEVLAEYRADDPGQPFRCPRTTYDALARVLAATTKLTKFYDIQKLLKKELGELPAVYQIRVALRFWVSDGVELVEKIRARYRASEPACFVQSAGAAWTKRVASGIHRRLDKHDRKP
jgi:hypothetical protein